MAIESTTDVASFFDVDEFGVLGAVNPVVGSNFNVNGIFDNDHLELDVDAGIAVSTSEPQFVCATADVTGSNVALQGDVITIATIAYEITDVKPDGTGVTTLMLVVQ